MLTYEEFETCLFEISEEIPDQFYRELNGGIIVKEERKIHPQSRGDELCIMGEYCVRQGMGRYIILYYGSFVQQYAHRPDAFWKMEMRHVLEHELTHHLESLAGEKDLEVEDEVELMKYMGGRKD